MASEQPSHGTPAYEVEAVRQLAELMSQHDLSEIDLSTAGTRLRLRRGPKTVAAPAPTAATSVVAAPPPAAESPRPAKKYLEIKSEGPGLFYAKPEPQAEMYVKLGSTVTPTTVVGKIGAMKIFTDIPAGCSGTIVEVLVENEQPVEYGTVLFRVDPS
ncbi:MAG: acetyl-CoA carboxylase biotin carboxyl carrier protein [Gemmataceae bacterium]